MWRKFTRLPLLDPAWQQAQVWGIFRGWGPLPLPAELASSPHHSQSRGLRSYLLRSACLLSAPPISLAREASRDKVFIRSSCLSPLQRRRDSWQISWFTLSGVTQASGQNTLSEDLPNTNTWVLGWRKDPVLFLVLLTGWN